MGVLHPAHVSVEQENIFCVGVCQGKVGSCIADPRESDLSSCSKWGCILN